MTHRIIRGRFRAIAPGIAAIAVTVLIAAGQIAFAPSADATEPERSGPTAGDSCTQISSSVRVVDTTTIAGRVDRVFRTIERTTRYRCIDAGSDDDATYTYTARTRWTETQTIRVDGGRVRHGHD